MNLLSELKVKLEDKEIVLKLSNKALYRAQLELEKPGLLDLIACIDSMDLNALYTILKHCTKEDISVEDLMDSELTIVQITEFIAQNISVLFDGKKKKPTQVKKKK